MTLFVNAFAAVGLLAMALPGAAQEAGAADEDLAGRRVVASQAGEPFCTDRAELQDYRSATASADEGALSTLESCSTFKQPLRVAVLTAYPGSDVVKARVYVDRGSVDGFTTRSAVALR